MKQDKILYLQIIGGLSGDMFLALMADLGVDLKELESIFSKYLPVKIHYQKRRNMGFSGTRVDIDYPKDQQFRNLESLKSIIKKLDVEEEVKRKSIQGLTLLAEVEAEVHGIGINEVHFHEIGAVDTLVDVLGSIWALKKLSISRIYSSKIPLFEGFVECSHGKIPLPAPATLKFLRGKPTYFVSEQKELITPTGALLLDTLVDSFHKKPEGKLIQDGIGIGHMDLSIPNMVRGMVFLKEHEDVCGFLEDEVFVLETNVDHITGEEIGYIFDNILRHGALDIFFIPGVMKKNRPGGMLKVICYEEKLDEVLNFLFKTTMSLGIRINKTKRVKLDRTSISINTKHGEVDLKEFKFEKKTYKRIEFDSMEKLSKKLNTSPVQIRLKLMETGIESKDRELE